MRLMWIFLWIGLLPACALFNKDKTPTIADDPDTEVVVPDEPQSPEDTVIAVAPVDTLQPVLPDLFNKAEYNVVLMLPFMLDTLSRSFLFPEPPKTPDPDEDEILKEEKFRFMRSSQIAIEFYEGCLMALDSLKAKGLSINLHVFDTENDIFKVSTLISQPEVENADLIIGPIYNSCLRIASNFALENGINLVSPLSPSPEITRNNPFYTQINPPLEVHLRSLFRYATETYDSANMLILYQDTESEMNNTAIIKQARFELQDSLNNDFSLTSYIITKSIDESEKDSDKFEYLSDYLDSNRTNVVFIPSLDEPFITACMRQLNTQKKENGMDIVVMGMPSWDKLQTIRLDYFMDLNTHISSSYHIQDTTIRYQIFALQFYQRFNYLPSEFSIKGYDIISFYGDLLLKHGLGYVTAYEDHEYKAFHNKFHIAPRLRMNDTEDSYLLDFFENDHVWIMKYANFSLKPVQYEQH